MSSVEQTPLNKDIEVRTLLSQKFLQFELLKRQKHKYKDDFERSCKYKDRCLCRSNKAMINWYTYRISKNIRSIYLCLIRNQYKCFSYYNITFWKIVCRKKKELIQNINYAMDEDGLSDEIYKYMILTRNTIRKYDSNYGLFLACVMHRLFCYDIANVVLEYI